MTTTLIDEFKTKLGEIQDVHAALGLLSWDQEVYMPPKAAFARGKQLATLSALAHRMFTSDDFGHLLARLARGENGASGDDAALISETRYDYDRATKLPEGFVQRFAEARSAAYESWVGARKESDFKVFLPHIERIVALNKEKAEYMGYDDSPYDALLEEYERGMTTAKLRPLFADLAEKQSALVDRITKAAYQPDTAWMQQQWDTETQWQFTLQVLGDMGYDFEAGRQDKSVHPFTTSFDVQDVRVTTRVSEDDPFEALTGAVHEGGHALYEQGFRESDRRTPLASAPSLGIHESQSRLWENIIGRSRPFWKHYGPKLRECFPDQLKDVADDQIYEAINRVAPSFIRVEADECTYNLHIILRFELEVDLIEDRLKPKDVPDAWNAKVKEYLGLDVPNDALGCLQDIHWSHGSMGYFPTYALGNLYSAQLFEQIHKDIPDLWERVETGDFTSLLDWLRERVHQFGRRKQAVEIVRDATGKEPSAAPFLAYLEEKYGALYRLDD